MDPEDLELRQKLVELRKLDPLSIDELEVYVAELQAEIARAHAAIAHKRAIRDGAVTLFKS